MEDNGHFIRTLFKKHAAFNVLALLVSTVGPIVCNVWAGLWYGSGGLAVVALCAPMFFLAGFFGFTISGGASVLAAKAIARDELDEVNRIYSAAIVLSVITGGGTFGGLLLFRREAITLFTGNTELNIEGYFVCTLLYAFATVLGYIPLYFSRVTGQNKTGVLFTVTLTVLTFITVPILKSSTGLASIALGQAVSTASATIICMFLLRKHVRIVFPHKLNVRQIASVGSPMGLSRLYSFIGTFVLNGLFLKAGGSAALAVYGVVATLNRFMASVTIGSAQTVAPLAGVFHEERDITSSRQLMKTAFASSNSVLVAVCVLLVFLRAPLSALFGLNPDAITIPLILNCAYLLLSLNASLFTAYYNASGRLLLANGIPFLQDFAILLPLAGAFGASVYGVWSALPLASLAALLLLLATVLALKMKDQSLSFPLLLNAQKLEQGRYVSFSVDSVLEQVNNASAKISEFCEENGINPKETMLISMSIEEILGLIVTNSRNQNVFTIAVRLFLLDETTVLRIRNEGIKFNPIKYYEEHISTDLEKSLDIIGLKYIVAKAKVIYYRETFGVNNLVVIL